MRSKGFWWWLGLAVVGQGRLVAVPMGWLELRPTYINSSDTTRTENEVGLGMRWNETNTASFVQEFQINPNEAGLGDAYLKGEFPKLFKSSRLSFDYEPRLYLPVSQGNRDQGFIGAARNYFKLETPLTANVSLGIWEIPIFYAYSRSSTDLSTGIVVNPWFENQIEFLAFFSFFDDKLKIKVPLIVQSIFQRDTDSTQVVKLYPEAIFAVTSQLGIGAGYSTDNLIAEDGFGKGWGQLIVNYAL